MGSQAERVRIAFQLFDTEGVNMVNLFGQGADNVAAMLDEADKLNITVSQLDTTKAVMMNDMMDKLHRIFNAVVREITMALLPAMLAVAEWFVEWVKAGGGWGESLTKWIDRIIDGFAEIARAGNFIKGVWYGMQAVIANLVGWVSKLAAKIAGLFSEEWATLLETVAEEEFAAADKLFDKGRQTMDKSL